MAQNNKNQDFVAADLDPDQIVQDAGQGDDAQIYANTDGAQSGGTRAFNANARRTPTEHVQEDAALTGSVSSRTIESDQQGITNHSASEEAARQKKVVSERPDAQAGVDQAGHKVA